MRAVPSLVGIQLASGRRKGGSDRDVRRPYEVQTVKALGSSSVGLPFSRAERTCGYMDGRIWTDGVVRGNYTGTEP
jgi:hypothetical protein